MAAGQPRGPTVHPAAETGHPLDGHPAVRAVRLLGVNSPKKHRAAWGRPRDPGHGDPLPGPAVGHTRVADDQTARSVGRMEPRTFADLLEEFLHGLEGIQNDCHRRFGNMLTATPPSAPAPKNRDDGSVASPGSAAVSLCTVWDRPERTRRA